MKLFLCALAMAFCMLSCDETARIQFNELNHDFGTVPQMFTAKHVFTFTNAGVRTLQIKDLHPD